MFQNTFFVQIEFRSID